LLLLLRVFHRRQMIIHHGVGLMMLLGNDPPMAIGLPKQRLLRHLLQVLLVLLVMGLL
jgi:hypothetical protein